MFKFLRILFILILVNAHFSSNSSQVCSEVNLEILNNDVDGVTFNVRNLNMKGVISFSSDGTLFIQAPHALNTYDEISIELYSKNLQCLVEKMHLKNPIVSRVVFDMSPYLNICRAAKFYLREIDSVNTEFIANYNPKNLRKNRDLLVKLADKFGYFDEFKTVIQGVFGSKGTIESEWVEKIVLIDGKQFVRDYGLNGELKKNYCGLSKQELTFIGSELRDRLYPLTLRRIGIRIN